jgi:hypothetical protein
MILLAIEDITEGDPRHRRQHRLFDLVRKSVCGNGSLSRSSSGELSARRSRAPRLSYRSGAIRKPMRKAVYRGT